MPLGPPYAMEVGVRKKRELKMPLSCYVAVVRHAVEAKGKDFGLEEEACGLLVVRPVVDGPRPLVELGEPSDSLRLALRYQPCLNVAEDPRRGFMVDPEIQREMVRVGGAIGLVHSHPRGLAYPSGRDLVVTAPDGWWYLVVGLGRGKVGMGAWQVVGGKLVRAGLSLYNDDPM